MTLIRTPATTQHRFYFKTDEKNRNAFYYILIGLHRFNRKQIKSTLI